MKIHILLGGALLVILLLEAEGKRFHGRGGRGGGRGRGGHGGRGGDGGRRWHNRPDRPRRQNFTMVCSQSAEAGNCKDNLKMWFYNATSKQCEMFTYSGCEGNANRFWTQRGCNHRCSVSEPCNKPLDTGYECEDGEWGRPRTLYYYDMEENECKEFEFNGCGGNRNRFRYVKHCQKRCLDQDEESEDSSEAMEILFTDDDSDEEYEFIPYDVFDDEESDDDDSRSRRALRRPERPNENGCPRHMCMMFCRWGFQKDERTGCDKCVCNPPPRQLRPNPRRCSNLRQCRMACKNGFKKDPETGCAVCACNEEPSVCPPVRCRMSCRNYGGWAEGPDGCPICRCKDFPRVRSSPPQESDDEEEIGGEEEEEEVRTVRRMCPMIRCRPCRHGHKRDEMGCRTCECNAPPELEATPEACGERPQCRRVCRQGFEKNEQGCPTCECKQQQQQQRICRPIRCPMMDNCPFGRGRDENGCPTCQCRRMPKSPVCSQPKVSGPCMAFFNRFYFDEASGECKQFVYGGCRGNENNFQSIQECTRQCMRDD